MKPKVNFSTVCLTLKYGVPPLAVHSLYYKGGWLIMILPVYYVSRSQQLDTGPHPVVNDQKTCSFAPWQYMVCTKMGVSTVCG